MRRRPASRCNKGRLQIYLDTGQRVRCLSLSPPVIATICAAGLVAAAWLIGATAYIVFNQEIREASHFYLVEKQRAYEDRIATLRRQIDEINSRQFLDQVAYEGKLDSVRRRQQSLEERQMQMAGLLEALDGRQLGFRMKPSDEEKRAEASRAASITGSTWSPLLIGRPRPAAQSGAVSVREAPRSSATQSVSALEQATDRLWDQQDQVLGNLEAGLTQTIEQLVAVPKAIGAPLPDLEDQGGGIGGPFVELRGHEHEHALEDQIARIERAVERVETLGRHIRRLPVRLPVKGGARVTSSFGSRMDPFLRRRAMHTGIDFRASTGTPVVAAAAGRVTRAGRAGGYGNLVEVDHGSGYTTRYAHLSRIDVSRGQSVAPGDVIGAAGSTGRSTGPHLHYETRVKGRAVDPAPFVGAAELLPEGF